MADGDLGVTALTIGQGIGAFYFFLPKLSEVRRADSASDVDMVGDVRMGEVAAVILTLGVGTIAASLSGSPMPAYVAVVVSITLVCVYETALRRSKPMNPSNPIVRNADA